MSNPVRSLLLALLTVIVCGSDVAAQDRPNPCATSHKGLFYANDCSYLNGPCYQGNCLGDELDVIAKYGLNSRSNVLIGWSHFWRGSKILAPTDADFFYAQWELSF